MRRRDFLAAACSLPLAAEAKRPTFCIFSKHMAQFGYEELGKQSRELGFEGVDLTVRAKGHVLPERASADLPRAVAAIRAAGLTVPMITTNILRADEPATRPILATAAKLGIPLFKPGYYRYKLEDVERELEQARRDTAGVVALARELGIAAGFHNHSGDHIGSAVWDIRAIVQDLDPKWVGYYFDPAHATIEGGLAGWRISQNIVSKRLKMVALKDFYWKKAPSGKWAVAWCPMGEGMVDWKRVFADLARAGFTGPLTLHVEYDPKDELAAIAADVAFVKKQLAAAYTL